MSTQVSADGGFFPRFLKSEGGATAIEYALIAGGITLAIVAAVYATGEALLPKYQAVEAGFQQN